jgi:hypothetical protein
MSLHRNDTLGHSFEKMGCGYVRYIREKRRKRGGEGETEIFNKTYSKL